MSRNVMVWLGAGMDAGDGQLSLKRPCLPLDDEPWTCNGMPERSKGVLEAILDVHRKHDRGDGRPFEAEPAWSLFRNMVTLHPLGGCRMGATPDTGVVNHLGQVFGYQHLYVVDGSILPTATGRNPSHTIAALAERIAAHVN